MDGLSLLVRLAASVPPPHSRDPIRFTYGLHRALPYWRQTFEQAALVIVAAPRVLRELPYRARARSVILAENGVDIDHFTCEAEPPVSQRRPFTILFVGRLIPLKQPALILDAVSRMERTQDETRVVYVGEGPEGVRIKAQAERLGLTKQVHLVGAVPHHELPAHYRNASVLALPSIHESGGAVLLEGMACGLPSVVVDYGGPGEYVVPGTGIKVALGTYSEMVAGFATAFGRLRRNAGLLDEFSRCARHAAETRYSWTAKAAQMIRLYHSVLGQS